MGWPLLSKSEIRFAASTSVERALHYLDIAALLDTGQVGPNAAQRPLVQLSDKERGDVRSKVPPVSGTRANDRDSGQAAAEPQTEANGVLGTLRELIVRLEAIEQRIASPTPPLTQESAAPATIGRPIGRVEAFLEDVAARGFPPRGLLDVGANRGSWTQMALAVFPGLPYILVEPQREMVAPLTALAKRPGCHFFNVAAGASPGELVQTIWPDLGGSSFLPPVDEAALRDGRQRRTKVVTLDSILTGPCRDFSPDLVKLDIQGFELEALAGGRTLFGRTELFIMEMALFEFMPRQPLVRDVINFMAERNYELYDITEFGRRPHDGALGQVDLAFVKASGMFRQSVAW